MTGWLDKSLEGLGRGEAVVRVAIAAVRGSAPRDAGAWMTVGPNAVEGTIGGGHLEWKAIGIARDMLSRSDADKTQLDRMVLGATLGQCCGGVVELWFEKLDAADLEFLKRAQEATRGGGEVWLKTRVNSDLPEPRRELCGAPADNARNVLLQNLSGETWLFERLDSPRTPLWLFGAGHVGSALVKVLADMPLAITWVDSREGQFAGLDLPANVTPLCAEFPQDELVAAPHNAFHLILTHSHDLDFEICKALLKKNQFASAGLIGSRTKAAKFAHRFHRLGFAPAQFNRITCPIGVDGIRSKLPSAIAIAVAAQLLQAMEAHGQRAVPGVGALDAMPVAARG